MAVDKQIPSATLLNAVTTAQTSDSLRWGEGWGGCIQADIAGTGAVTATVNIYGGNVNTFSKAVLLGTISLNGTTTDKGGFYFQSVWPFMWADLTAISGTGAAVTVTCGGTRS